MLPQSESGSERGTTRSGVSDGTITLTNGANQTQDLASLNRDTSNLKETVSRTPDLQNLLNDQSRLMAAATAAGEAVARDIGTYADKKRDAAQNLADATTDPELKAQYQKEADDWKEGGDYRAAMHAAGGAIIAGLGGGNALGGALGAGLTSKLGGALNELSENIQKARPTGNADIDQALAQIVATSVGTAVGAAVGGSSGAFTGYNTDRFNRQLAPNERKWAKDNAEAFADFYKKRTGDAISVSDAENLLLAAGYRLVDAVASRAPGSDRYATEYISMKSGSLFSSTDAERRDVRMNGNANGTLTPEQRALNTGHVPNVEPLSWAVSAGVYYGVGGELEIGFTGVSLTEVKLGLGVGYGAHGWLTGAGQGANSDLVSYGSSPKVGDFRAGSSVSASAMLGPLAGQFGGGAGLFSNIQGTPITGGYWQTKGAAAIGPNVGVGAEIKINIIEFNYKWR